MQERELSLFVFLETHRAPHLVRATITEMTLIAEPPHIKYRSAILIRSDLKVKGVSVWEQDNVELISNEMHGVVVHYVYKLPNEKFGLPALGYGNLSHIVIGDFNSYNPNYIFVYDSIANMCGKSVMEPILHKQHRPNCVRADPVIGAHPTPFRRRFNLRKQTGTAIQWQSTNLLKTLNPSQRNPVVSKKMCVWLPEGIFQEDVEQTTYPVYQRNQRACMKTTNNSMQAILFTTVLYRLMTNL